MPSEIALRGRSIPRQVTAPKKEAEVEEAEGGSGTEARDAIARRAPDRETKKAGRYAAYLDGGERARSPDNKRADWVKGGDGGEGAAGGDGE